MTTRVRAIIIEKRFILLIHRIKDDKEYWVFPGGGVDDGETEKEALVREAFEELGVNIRVNEIFNKSIISISPNALYREVFYFCTIHGGKLGTGNGPEYQTPGSRNKYILEWIPFEDFKNKKILPQEIKDKVINEIIERKNADSQR